MSSPPTERLLDVSRDPPRLARPGGGPGAMSAIRSLRSNEANGTDALEGLSRRIDRVVGVALASGRGNEGGGDG